LTSPSRPTRRRLLIAALLALAFSCLVVVGYQWMQSTALAVLQAVSGPTLRDQHDSIGRWEPAVIGDDFIDGDGAKTPATSTARFRLGRSGSLTLEPASQVRFRRRGKGGRAVGLTVEVGEVEVRTNEGTLNLGSEFGELVLEPKSRVRLTRKGERLVVGVKLGRLRFASDQRVFGAGRRVTVAVGGLVLSDDDEASPTQPGDQTTPAAPPLGKPPERGDGVAFADLVVTAGESFVVHDEAPPTAVGFRFERACPEGARLEIGSKWTEGEHQVALVLGIGRHEYTLSCLNRPEMVVRRGELRILRDSGTRQLPTFTPTAQVTADGRTYTVLYQARLPSVTIAWPTAPAASAYTLTVDGTVLRTKAPSHTFPSGALAAGKHTATFAANTSPARASRPTTIVIKVDAQAPTGRVAEPNTGFSAGGTVPVAGQALPGWTVSVAGAAVEKDAAGRFATKVPVNGPLAIAFSHPTHGMHYYLRRPKGPRNH
jgi:hypothetical protein